MGNSRSFVRGIGRSQKARGSKQRRPVRVLHAFSPPARALARQKLLPMKAASPMIRKMAVGLVAAFAAFSPMKSRALESREPPPNSASFADYNSAFATYRRTGGVGNKKFDANILRVGVSPRLFGITNSGPMFVFEKAFNRTSPDTVRVGVAQKFSLPRNAVLKLGAFSPVFTNSPKIEDTRFGVILTKGQITADYFYRGVTSAGPAHGGGLSYDVGKKVDVGFGLGSKGYTDPGDSIRAGLRLKDVEKTLGLPARSLLSAAVDFGVTFPRNSPANASTSPEVDIGLAVSPTKNLKVGLDVWDLGARVGNKDATKISGFLVISF